MGVLLKECNGNLQFHFADAIDGVEFDSKEECDLGQMPRVDFIVEFPEYFLFLEVKNPQNPKAQKKGVSKFYENIQTKKLHSSLYEKYLHSFFFRWAEKKLDKSVCYLMLINIETGEYQSIEDEVRQKLIHLGSKSKKWVLDPLINCQIFNVETWNSSFPKWKVTYAE